ncbi:MAG TPA: exodeoxyribonuclease VII small subunit [Gemmatimonadaceae bacterium]|nr:exodeoxyribonuclease VII small subunit [Gemmatimonadaceae bacterium]
MSYEREIARLDEIISALERDELELDRAIALFEEGVARLRAASESLAKAEAQVKRLVERSDGSFSLRDLGE